VDIDKKMLLFATKFDMDFIFRDLHDIGCYAKVIDGCQQLDKETR